MKVNLNIIFVSLFGGVLSFLMSFDYFSEFLQGTVTIEEASEISSSEVFVFLCALVLSLFVFGLLAVSIKLVQLKLLK